MSLSLPSLFLRPFSCLRPVVVLVVTGWLTACGGGGDSDVTTATATAIGTRESFPIGLVVASPAELSSAAPTTTASSAMARSLAVSAGFGAGRAELTSTAAQIEAVLAGDTRSVSLAGLLSFGHLFQQDANAGCYGPSMLYANHEDGTGTESGVLPGGDLGLWLPTDDRSGQPCVVAQLNERTAGVRLKTRQALLLMAAMRAMIANSGGTLALPAAGGRTDLTAPFTRVLALLPPLGGLTVQAATVALDASGKHYTYRLALAHGSGSSARSGEVVLQHTPGATAIAYSGVLRMVGFDLGTDPAFGCSDRMSGSRYQRAQVTTVRYSRHGDQIDFGARSGRYCGAPADLADADHAGQVAAFTSSGELDPAVRLDPGAPGSAVVAGTSTGWRGSFDRFGGAYDRTTGTGQFLYAWQAGTGDRHARALAATATYDSATDTRTVQGYFAFSADLASTDGRLLGMVCNWAGPGMQHTPAALFQSQTATLTGLASTFTATASRLTYAPTNTCSATTTVFDANADGALAPGEGQGTLHALDTPASATTSVQGELVARGYRQPGYF